MPRGFVCLAYHRVTDDPAAQRDSYTVSPARFRAQMGWLAQHGWQGMGISEALHAPRRRAIALSFDGGYADFAEHAWPVLHRYGFRATLFVVAARAGRAADWPGAEGAPLLGWVALRLLAEQGLEIGSHGLTSMPLDALSPVEARANLSIAYVITARQIGQPPVGLAYPFGRHTGEVVQAAQAAGFRWACTAWGGRNRTTTPRFMLRRTLVAGRDGPVRFALKVWSGSARPGDLLRGLRREPGSLR